MLFFILLILVTKSVMKIKKKHSMELNIIEKQTNIPISHIEIATNEKYLSLHIKETSHVRTRLSRPGRSHVVRDRPAQVFSLITSHLEK